MHMQPPPTTPDHGHDSLILDRLDVSLPSPFLSPTIVKDATPRFPPLHSSAQLTPLSSPSPFLLDNETPTTAVASLPTPGPSPVTLLNSESRRTYADVVRGRGNIDYTSWYAVNIDDNGSQFADPADLNSALPYPQAPKLKDMDSFTDGTGRGSFDFSLYSSQEDLSLSQSQLNVIPDAASKTEQPLRSIESWRDSVPPSVSPVEAQFMGGASEPGAFETPGPRGLKRHLSWTQSDVGDGYDGGAERARGRWAALTAIYTGNYDYAFLDEPTRADDCDSDGLYYRSEDEEAGYVCDDANLPTRPASAPPDL